MTGERSQPLCLLTLGAKNRESESLRAFFSFSCLSRVERIESESALCFGEEFDGEREIA